MTDNPARALMRLAHLTGGEISGSVTRYDKERGGRVLELRVFWPGQSGYEAPPDLAQTADGGTS